MAIESSVSATVSQTIEQELGYSFTFGVENTHSTTITNYVTVGGKYRYERRAYVSVFVFQKYLKVIPSTGLYAIPPRIYRYYFRGNSVMLGYNNSSELMLSRYIEETPGEYMFDKDYYVNQYGIQNTNFIAV